MTEIVLSPLSLLQVRQMTRGESHKKVLNKPTTLDSYGTSQEGVETYGIKNVISVLYEKHSYEMDASVKEVINTNQAF